RRIRVHDPRHELRFHIVREQSVAMSGFRIKLFHIREWKDIDGIKETRKRSGGSAGQRKPIIETSAAAACDVRHHSIEHFAMGFVFVKSVVEIRPQKTSAL